MKKRIAILSAAWATLIFFGTACSGTTIPGAASGTLTGGTTETDAPTAPSTADETTGESPNLPIYEVAGSTLRIYREGTARLEAEAVDTANYKKSGDNATVIVERADASGGKFLAAATGDTSKGGYFEFWVELAFPAELTMTAAYAQTGKWKGCDEDLTQSYTYLINENKNMPLQAEKTVLAAREDITAWESFSYTAVTLPAGRHSFRVSVAANTGKGNPNIDYFDFAIRKLDYVPPVDGTVPENDFHTALQYRYLTDPNPENITAYANGVQEWSRPAGTLMDFSADCAESADGYVLQYAGNESFDGAVTVNGLQSRSYRVYNLMLGETVWWRGGTTLAEAQANPVHSMTIEAQGPRNLYIDGVTNVRDIGGYASSLVADGKIRQRLYYRGAKLDGITEAGKAEMLRLGIRQEIDLRDAYQCQGPYVDGIRYTAVSIPSGTESRRFEEFADEYKTIFGLIAKADENPVYLHCTAGADRTGICTFILLTVCGADYNDIARDYLFTNFSTQGSRINNFTTEFKQWWSKLDNFAGETKAEKAKAWLISKGVTAAEVERIREIFVEGYTAQPSGGNGGNVPSDTPETKEWTKYY